MPLNAKPMNTESFSVRDNRYKFRPNPYNLIRKMSIIKIKDTNVNNRYALRPPKTDNDSKLSILERFNFTAKFVIEVLILF